MASPMRRAIQLEYATIAWNTVEAVVALVAGIAAGSLALTAFGIDSVIELFSAVVVLIELGSHQGHAHDDSAERVFLRLIGSSFFALAAYILIDAIYDLIAGARPEHSIPGIILTVAAFLAMSVLATAKHRTGHTIGSLPLIADSRETRLCSLLALVALTGLALNASLGWWWADPVAALGIAFLAVREGSEALSGKHPEHH